MKTQTRVLASVAASLAVSALAACMIYFIVRDMDKEAARGRVYDEIRSKTYALNLSKARFRNQPDPSLIHQTREIQRSLEKLLRVTISLDAREEPLVRQIRTSSRELGYSLEKLISSHFGAGVHMENERYDVLASQLWMKTQFISDDTRRLMDISQSRIAAAQKKAGLSIFILIVALVLINGAISFFSGRSIVRVQDGLEKQRKWLQVTLASIGDGVIATGRESKIVFLNPVAAALTGWPIDEALGRPVQEVFRIMNEKTREPAGDIVRLVMRDGINVPLANHTVLVALDAREIPIEDSAAPIKDGTGNVAGVVLVFQDATEKRRARGRLEQSRLDLDRAQEVGQIGSWRLDVRHDVLTWSDENHRIFGVPKGAPMTYQTFLGIVHPDDMQYVDTKWRAGLAGEPYDIEHRILVGGQVKWVRESLPGIRRSWRAAGWLRDHAGHHGAKGSRGSAAAIVSFPGGKPQSRPAMYCQRGNIVRQRGGPTLADYVGWANGWTAAGFCARGFG